MKIRRLLPDDAESYWKLRKQALRTDPDAFLVTYEEAIEKKNPIEEYRKSFLSEDTVTFGAFKEEQLVGNVTILRETRKKIRHRANIVAMYVDNQNRGEGIAKALLNKVIEMSKMIPEIEQLYLTVDSENDSAKELYKKVGFQKYAVEKNAIKHNGQYRHEEHMILFLEK
ncbi:GNAT family N-acetyltransferase [Bacillus sinesaloumensis]|uniref:GNAT family N-acetyltransferase n=1 Tax=Litchfieldia sinesaloumensis TaxID=1926280 RepID=UPI00098857E9|nr:GNAT family N-acetyltransferase [Bacillus sinesaloumensis]